MSRLSRIGLPLSIGARTGSRGGCLCSNRARAYRYRARLGGVRARRFGKVARADRRAVSMSPDEPWATDANFSPLEGSSVSKYAPAAGACHAPLMKCPKRWPWRSSQDCASFGSSGAGPYSMLTNFSAMLMSLAQLHRRLKIQLATTLWDDDTPPNSALSRDVPVAARYPPTVHSRQNEKAPRASTTARVLLSSWPASRSIASRCEYRRLP